MRNLSCRRLQCDEIWSFCYAKAKNVPEEVQGQFGYGDVWTWTAIDAADEARAVLAGWRAGPARTQPCSSMIWRVGLPTGSN